MSGRGLGGLGGPGTPGLLSWLLSPLSCAWGGRWGVLHHSPALVVLQCHLVPCDREPLVPSPCWGAAGRQHTWVPWHRYVWEKDGAALGPESGPRVRLDEAGTLHISQTWSGDIGTYTCKVISAGGNDSRSAHLRVR